MYCICIYAICNVLHVKYILIDLLYNVCLKKKKTHSNGAECQILQVCSAVWICGVLE